MKRMSPMLHFIINPKAGNGKPLRVWKLLRPILDAGGFRFMVHETAGPGDAGSISRRIAEGALAAEGFPAVRNGGSGGRGQFTLDEQSCERIIIAVIGGDGTLREAAAGLLDSRTSAACPHTLPLLTLIPAGSGNDFARGHGIPLNPVKALNQVLSAVRDGRSRHIDVLRIDNETAVSSCGAGLDSTVALAVNGSPLKRLLGRLGLGRLAYAFILLRVLAGYRPARAVLEVDGVRHQLEGVWLISFSNIPSYGGGMRINPDARPDDGLIDVCVVRGMSRIKLIVSFPRVYSGRHTDIAGVSFLRGKNFRLECSVPLPVHADGDDAGMTPASIRVESRQLEIVG